MEISLLSRTLQAIFELKAPELEKLGFMNTFHESGTRLDSTRVLWSLPWPMSPPNNAFGFQVRPRMSSVFIKVRQDRNPETNRLVWREMTLSAKLVDGSVYYRGNCLDAKKFISDLDELILINSETPEYLRHVRSCILSEMKLIADRLSDLLIGVRKADIVIDAESNPLAAADNLLSGCVGSSW